MVNAERKWKLISLNVKLLKFFTDILEILDCMTQLNTV